jgi:hypothetical protein
MLINVVHIINKYCNEMEWLLMAYQQVSDISLM